MNLNMPIWYTNNVKYTNYGNSITNHEKMYSISRYFKYFITNCDTLWNYYKLSQKVTPYLFHRFTGGNLHNLENILVSLKLLEKRSRKLSDFFYENSLKFTHFSKFLLFTFAISLPNVFKLSLRKIFKNTGV